MLGEPFIEKRVIRVQKLHDAAIFLEHVLDKTLGFLAHGLAQRFVKVGKQFRIGRNAFEGAEAQPLLGEVLGQAPAPWGP